MKAGTIIVGKRVTVGAAVMAVSEGFQAIFPEHATAIGSFTIPVIFLVQLVIANKLGVTQ